MFYCPKCLNIYNITKSLKNKDQVGGAKLEDIVDKILKNEDIENYKFDENDLDDLPRLQNFKKLTNKQKDFVYNFINELIEKKPKKETKNMPHREMYFLCKNCGNSETIKEGTIIVSRESSRNVSLDNNFNAKEYLQMNILPRTRQYSCPNDKCESHKKAEVKSAVFMRLPNTYKVRYICESCETTWNIS